MWSSALPEDSRACVAELPDVNPVTILRVRLGVAFELGHDLINLKRSILSPASVSENYFFGPAGAFFFLRRGSGSTCTCACGSDIGVTGALETGVALAIRVAGSSGAAPELGSCLMRKSGQTGCERHQK